MYVFYQTLVVPTNTSPIRACQNFFLLKFSAILWTHFFARRMTLTLTPGRAVAQHHQVQPRLQRQRYGQRQRPESFKKFAGETGSGRVREDVAQGPVRVEAGRRLAGPRQVPQVPVDVVVVSLPDLRDRKPKAGQPGTRTIHRYLKIASCM
jgi:hypothetical protein